MPACTPELRNIRKEKWLKVYSETFNRAEACKAVKLNRSSLWRWLRSDRAFAQAVLEIDESAIDEAESKLIELVQSGNLQAVKFLLKTKGRSRGYGDRFEITQTLKQETIDTKRLEFFLADAKTRKSLELLAVNSLKAVTGEIEDDDGIEYRDTEYYGE